MTTTLTVNVVEDDPTAKAPVASLELGSKMMLNAVLVDVTWPAATDPTSPIAGYEVQRSVGGAAWGPTVALAASQRSATFIAGFNTTVPLPGPCDRQRRALEPVGRRHAFDRRADRGRPESFGESQQRVDPGRELVRLSDDREQLVERRQHDLDELHRSRHRGGRAAAVRPVVLHGSPSMASTWERSGNGSARAPAARCCSHEHSRAAAPIASRSRSSAAGLTRHSNLMRSSS